MRITVLLAICGSVCASFNRNGEIPALETIFEWKIVDYDIPYSFKHAAIASKSLIPENNIPIGFAIWRDKLFLTVFRWSKGIGSALNYINITTATNDRSPLLKPYPSIEANFINEHPARKTTSLPSEQSIISASRAWVDKCNRLWVIDAGNVDAMGENRIITSPAIVIFDLLTDTLIRRYRFPESQIKTDSTWANIQVDVETGNCGDAYSYISDLLGMIVYSFKRNISWRVDHNFFGDDPLSGNFMIKDVNFQWTDGLFGIAISNKFPNGDRRVYFHSFASTKEFYVPNSVLKNQSYISEGNFYYDFKLIGDRGQWSQASRSFYDEKTDIIFYPVVHDYAIKCWNTKFPLETWDTIHEDFHTMVFPNDVVVDDNRNLWTLANSLPIFLYGKWDTSAINIRILSGNVDSAVQETECAEVRYVFQ